MSTIAFQSTRLERPSQHLHLVPSPTPAPKLHLTGRGKAAILAATIALLAFLVIFAGASSMATGQSGVPEQTTTVTVLPGQTLWQIAAAANPSGDIRETVDDIVRLNALPNASALQLGTRIAVPVYN